MTPTTPTAEVEAPEKLDWDNLDQYTPEQIEAYNAAVEERLSKRIDKMKASEKDAVNALRTHAQTTLKTATVDLPDGGPTLEVRTRIPTSVERMHERLGDLETIGRVQEARDVACQMMAAMIVTEGFDSPEVWEMAAQMDGAGLQWLMECADVILQPALERAEAAQGNLRRAKGTR